MSASSLRYRLRGAGASVGVAGPVLVAVAMVWGSSFYLTKELLVGISMTDFLATRFVIAGCVGAVVFAPRLRRAGAGTWWRGGVLGLVYAVSQLLQTYGLTLASASVSGFLTALYVVGTPLVAWLAWRVVPGRSTALALLLATAGAAVLGLSGVHAGVGELALLGCAVGYSVHVALLGRWSVGRDPLALAAVQMIALGVAHALAASPGGVALPTVPGQWLSVLYLAVVVGLLALLGQTWAQARMDAARAAVIMALEPVFAAVFAVGLGHEAVTWRLVCGGSLIFAGSVVAELGPVLARWRVRSALAS